MSMRLFIGIPSPPALLNELSAVTARLRSNGDGLRWAPPESWHITLQFLGSAGQEQYECVVARLRELHLRPVSVRLGELGFFDRAGIFFADVRVTPELVGLQQRVTAATGLCGFVPEDRPYYPHITLARSKGKDGARGLRELKRKVQRQPKFTGFTADEFLLYESVTAAGGARYEVRERFTLDG